MKTIRFNSDFVRKNSIYFSVIIIAFIVFLFSACEKTEKIQGVNSDITETVSEELTVPEIKTEQEKKTGVFKIGGIGPITGNVAIYGEAVECGAKLAVEEINSNGGINGYQIEFLMMDDMHNEQMSVSSYNSLKEWGMHILMGTVTSYPCKAVADEAVYDNMFMITPTASMDSITSVGDNIFSLCYVDSDKGSAVAEYVAKNKLASNVAVIYDLSDSYSVGQKDKFVSKATENGLNVVAVESYTVYTSNDFSKQVRVCKDLGAELIFIPVDYRVASVIFGNADAIDYSPIFFGTDTLDGITYDDSLKNPLIEGVMILYPFVKNSTDKETAEFVKNFKNFADSRFLNIFAAYGYDAIYAIKAAAENADITPQMDYSDICEKMKVSFTQIKMDGITGHDMTWNSDGTVEMTPNVVIVENAVMVPVN